MTESLDRNHKKWNESFIDEVEKAREEINLAERAFQWVKNDPDAVDAAVSRIEAAIDRYNFLIKQAKEMGIAVDKKAMYEKLLKQKDGISRNFKY
jgi:predicted  nucleic acid-binding Zn-ribbon protein